MCQLILYNIFKSCDNLLAGNDFAGFAKLGKILEPAVATLTYLCVIRKVGTENIRYLY